MRYNSIELVVADRGWIMERMARVLCEGLDQDCRIVDQATGRADLTYFLPYSIQRSLPDSIVVSFFTHQEEVEPARSRFLASAAEADYCVCMSSRYSEVLEQAGISNVRTITPGIDLELFKPKLVVGVVGRTYHTGRKGEALVAELLGENWLEFRFTGAGWPGPAESLSPKGLADFYASIDCLLIPSNIEGGPMPVLEALASGCTVLAPDVGFVPDYPHINYELGNAASAKNELLALYREKARLRSAVEDCSWDRYVEQHSLLFDELLRRRARYIPDNSVQSIQLLNHGSERHTQGGPTTRMALLKDHISPDQGLVDIVRVDEDVSIPHTDVAHVFNSWPLHTSEMALDQARENAQVVCFSPIVLDLRNLPSYENEMMRLLAADHVSEQSFESLRSETKYVDPSDSSYVLKEGVRDHFNSLRRACAKADKVIVLSDYEQRLLAKLGIEENKLFMVRNGIDVDVMQSADGELFRHAYGIVGEFVLCVGRIEPRKNQAGLALALAAMEVPIVFIGHVGSEEYFEQLKKVASKDCVYIDRLESREMLASAYHAASVCALVSWCEGAPLVALEAGAAGCPLLLSEMSGEREYFGSFAKYVHPLDFEKMRDAVRVDLLDQDGRTARSEYVVSRYSMELHTRSTLNVYRQPIGDVSSQLTIIDVTHLAHARAAGNDKTGMPKLEGELFERFRKSKGVRFLVWNSFYKTHVLFDSSSDITSFANEPNPVDEHATWYEAKAGLAVKERIEAMSVKRTVLTLVKMALRGMPHPTKNRVIDAIRRFKPNFNPVVEARHELSWELISARIWRRRSGLPAHPQSTSCPLQPSLPRGSRIVVTGQPWISNDKYLNSLVNLVLQNEVHLVVLVPDIVYVTHLSSFPLATRQGFHRRLNQLLAVSDEVVVPSKVTEHAILQFRDVEGHHFDVRRIPLPCPEIIGAPAKVRGLNSGQYVLYVASLNARKNHELLFETWRYLKTDAKFRNQNVKLVCAGTNQLPKEALGEISAGLADQVVFTGSVSDEELKWLYLNCLFSVYPSLVEGWGFPVQESLSYGKVCVASKEVPSAAEAENGGIVKLDPNDIYAWRATILSLVCDADVLQGLESNLSYSPQITWEQVATKIIN